jgi:hypothetical protein
MDIMIQQMKIMAKEENQSARKKWGNYGAGDSWQQEQNNGLATKGAGS